MSNQYLYLKLLLRNNLQLELDEYKLSDARECGLVCSFLGMRLASAFQPVMRQDGRVVGRNALLRADLAGREELTPDSAFEEAVRAGRVVQFDRLVRIIHLMNHARNFAEHELLFLSVHPRLLSSVNDHGRTFERILHYYSVPTSRVVIKIGEMSKLADDVLSAAANNYRSLGYRIAMDDFGASQTGLKNVLKLQPDIVKLDAARIQAAEHSRSAEDSLIQLVSRFHKAGIQVAIKGIESDRQLEIARNSGADLLQGYRLGCPEFPESKRGLLCRSERIAA